MKSQKVALDQLAELGNTYVPPSHNLPVSYTGQIRSVEPAHFSVFRQDEDPGSYETGNNRSDLYKILLLTKGRSRFQYREQAYRAAADCILFLKPAELRSWKDRTEEQDGYHCYFTPSFFAFNAIQQKALQDNLLFSGNLSPVLPLTATQADLFRDLFIKLHREFNNIMQYNTDMLRLYLHIILIEAGRAYDDQAAQSKASAAAVLIAQRFQQLLEEEAGKVIQGQVLRMKTVKQLADQLGVHPTHLNACVKSITGKTAREMVKNSLRVKLLTP